MKTTPTTHRILHELLPVLPKGSVVVAGYLNDLDQYWKVNYHWDYLVWMLDYCRSHLELSTKEASCVAAIRTALLDKAPSHRGYRNDKKVGETKDLSTPSAVVDRWKVVRQSKRDFKAINRAFGFESRAADAAVKRNAKAFGLATAPVARPGTSQHGTGFALDIEGNLIQIKAACQLLGATLVFNEKNHQHVEFAKGVRSISRESQWGYGTALA